MTVPVHEKLTPTEKRFLDALEEDSRTKAELHALLWDDMTALNGSAVSVHLDNLRKKLPKSYIIVFSGGMYHLHRIVRSS